MNFNCGIGRVVAWTAASILIVITVVACGKGSGDMGGGVNGSGVGSGGGGNPPTMGANIVTANATLTNDQEMFDQQPPSNSGASGTGTVTVNLDTGAISGGITLDSDFVATVAHIHQAPAGTPGPIIITLTQDTTSTNVWNVPAGSTLDAAQLQAFKDGDLYFNAHTKANSGGEIRGQIGRKVFVAFMTGQQAGTTATGTGVGLVVLDPQTNTADVTFTAQGLSETPNLAHIHTGPVNTQGGPVVVPMTLASSGGGKFTFSASGVDFSTLQTDLNTGNLYFNVHTPNNNPKGEVRGQIGRVVRFARPFDGAQQVPPVTSTGTGSGFAVLDESTRTINGSMTFSVTTPTIVHIHDGAFGLTGNVIVPFTTSGSASPFNASGTNTVLSPAAKDFLDGNTYMNVHTSANMLNGEIRGQLDVPKCSSGC